MVLIDNLIIKNHIEFNYCINHLWLHWSADTHMFLTFKLTWWIEFFQEYNESSDYDRHKRPLAVNIFINKTSRTMHSSRNDLITKFMEWNISFLEAYSHIDCKLCHAIALMSYHCGRRKSNVARVGF